MAYETPPQWIHGNLVTTANMRKYDNALDALNTRLGSNSPQNVCGVGGGLTESLTRWYFIHTHRYLWYVGKGFITHPDDGSIQMSLSETATDTTWERFDLSTVDWIYPGFLYEVTEVDGAMEMWR